MNTAIVRYVLGYVLRIESILMLLPIVTALIYQESQGYAYVIVALICFVLGTLLSLKKPRNTLF